MTQENCLYSFKDPCAIQMVSDVRGDLNQSWFWYETQRAQCTTCSDFFAPLVVFIDSTPVNMYEKVNVEAIMFLGGGLSIRFVQKHNHGAKLDLLLISKSRVVSRMQLENLLPRTIICSPQSDPPKCCSSAYCRWISSYPLPQWQIL